MRFLHFTYILRAGVVEMAFENVSYPSFIKQREGVFDVHFPTLLPEFGWENSLTSGQTKKAAIQNAKKALAYLLAGYLYDNEDLLFCEPKSVLTLDLRKKEVL